MFKSKKNGLGLHETFFIFSHGYARCLATRVALYKKRSTKAESLIGIRQLNKSASGFVIFV